MLFDALSFLDSPTTAANWRLAITSAIALAGVAACLGAMALGHGGLC